jgi:PAS domain S-box-containing protein
MKKPLRALIIEDSEFDAVLLVNQLRLGSYQVTWQRVDTPEAMRQTLAAQPWEIVFSDHQMPQFSAPEALRLLQESGLDLPFLIVSGGIGEATAVALMKAGAHDFLMKGHLGRLVPAVERELREAANRAARRQAEVQVHESERRYRLLWENSPDAILMMDPAGRIGFVNPAATAVFGYSQDELLGREFGSLLESSHGGGGAADWVQTLAGAVSQATTREFKGRHKTGHEVTVEIGFSQLEIPGQVWWLAFVRDITDRRRAEAALHVREQELLAARDIQQRLFPKAPPAIPGYDIAGATFPADEAGGDYFDYLPMLYDGLGIVVGDVSGHGMGPALIMAETRAYLRIVGLNRQYPSEALARANRVLADDLAEADRFVTVFFARLDAGARRLVYASAGHPAGYLLGPDGQLKRRLPRTGRALGMLPDSQYQNGPEVLLAPGDLLVLLTDGVEEAVNPENIEFGSDRALAVIRTHCHHAARDIVEALYAAVRDFTLIPRQSDDVTVVVLKVLPDSNVDAASPAS